MSAPDSVSDSGSEGDFRKVELALITPGNLTMEGNAANVRVLANNLFRAMDRRTDKAGGGAEMIIHTDLNILSEMNVFRFNLNGRTLIPRVVNLAALHPRLLQQYSKQLTIIIDNAMLTEERTGKRGETISGAAIRKKDLNVLMKEVAEIFPMRNEEQMLALAKVLS